MSKWRPIETAPYDTREMFVVKAFGQRISQYQRYDSDPWCVWREKGEFIRWPHDFPPTHWTPLPDTSHAKSEG